jgi:hypothetical protein
VTTVAAIELDRHDVAGPERLIGWHALDYGKPTEVERRLHRSALDDNERVAG